MDFENFLRKELDSNIYYVKFFMVYLLLYIDLILRTS